MNDQLVEEALQGWEVGYSWLCSPKTLTFLTKWTTGSSTIVIIKQTTIPILTILRHWRYCSMHIQYQRGCPTGRCRNLGWRSREAVVTRDYALGLETGRRTDHERLRNLSQSTVSATIFPHRIMMRLSFPFIQPRILLLSFPFHPPAPAFAATTAIHVHFKPQTRHATADKAPSEPPPTHAANARPRRQTQPRTPHIHATAFPFIPPSLSPRLASPRPAPHGATPRHATPPRLAAIVPTLDFPSLICFLCSAVV